MAQEVSVMNKAPSFSNTLFVIMSFEKSDYLSNCVQSFQKHAPPQATLWIYDDGSPSRKAQQYLKTLADNSFVVISSIPSQKKQLGRRSVGGLHANMNHVIDCAIRQQFEYVFFLQEDQQIVRDINSNFFQELERIFQVHTSCVHIVPLFFKGILGKSLLASRYRLDPLAQCYLDDLNGLSDVGVVSLERFKNFGLAYGKSETETSRDALAAGCILALMKNPVLMYIPWPTVNRPSSFGVAKILRKVNEWGCHCGFHPFISMTDEALNRLLSRDLKELPIAEEFLETREPLMKPWWFTDVFAWSKIKDPSLFVKGAWLFQSSPEYIELKNRQLE